MKVLKNLWVAISGLVLIALVLVTGLIFLYFCAGSVYVFLENINTITNIQALALIGTCVLAFQPYALMLIILNYASSMYREERELQELLELVDVDLAGGF